MARLALIDTTATSDARPAPSVGGFRLPAHASAAFLAGGLASIAVYFALPADAQSVAYVVIGLIAVGTIFTGALLRPADRRAPWYLFGAGILCEVGGDAVFMVYEVGLDREPPVPSTADALYLAGYPLILAGIILLVRRLGAQASRVALLDMAIVFAAVVMVQWVFLVAGYVEGPLGGTERLVGLAYPSIEVLLLVGLVQLLLTPARHSSTYWLLVVSVVLWVIADEVYGLNTSTYLGGHWIDACWLGSYVFWGAAALDVSSSDQPLRPAPAPPRLGAATVAVLGAALLSAPVTALLDRHVGARTHVVAAAIGAAVIAILVLVRLTGLLHAVERARADELRAREQAEEMQRRLAEQNERLVELDGLKDEFVSSVSHELRTPLTSIGGYAELLLEQELDDETRGFVKVIERNSGRLLELVNDLLFAARLQSGRLELQRAPFDVAAVAEQAVESAARQAGTAGVDLRLDVADGVPWVDGDSGRLGQVVGNLVTNAIKFTPPDGRVDVAVGVRGGFVTLAVADTGIGLAEDELPHVFERFFRSQGALDRHIPGTGLGLYISKAIVEGHGGRITVRSTKGVGTTFVVELPALERSDEDPELDPARPGASAYGRR